MTKFITFILSILIAACSCTSEQTEPQPEIDRDFIISDFSFREYPGIPVTVDSVNKVISAVFPAGATLKTGTIIFSTADGITATPASGTSVDISKDCPIYLSKVDGSACRWVLKCSLAKSKESVVYTISAPDCYVDGKITGKEISFSFPYGTDVTAIKLNLTYSSGAVLDPDIISAPADLTQPIELKITSEDGSSSNIYTLKAEIRPQDRTVRGVYLPSPNHTASFLSYDEVCKSLSLMADLNLNTLFVCTWAASKVAWESDVLLSNSTYQTKAAGNMYASYTGGSGDALKDIISVAHQKGIKVILWFEYGFMHAVGGVNTDDPVLAKHPEWIGISSTGGYSNYNGTDYYLNGYDPQVRGFLLDLMKEALTLYPEVDGIQGDDRMPAMPRNSGYDTVTKEAYKTATGDYPPTDCNNSAWVQWRLDLLNSFATDMRKTLKARKPSLIVCFAPNKYPWCKNNLMQDWPSWIKNGDVDLLTVQCYVPGSYRTDVSSSLKYIEQSGGTNLMNPAMILKNGANIMTEQTLVEQLKYNVDMSTNGESQFWFEGLRENYVQKVFRAFYPGKAEFPL